MRLHLQSREYTTSVDESVRVADLLLYISIWASLVAIAVVDAREHRIPNVGLGVVLFLSFLHYLIQPDFLSALTSALLAGLVLFAGSLALHLCKVMAPGDVKLLGVVGFVVGWEHCFTSVYWIALTSVLVGAFYAAIYVAENPTVLRSTLSRYATSLPIDHSISHTKQQTGTSKGKLHMPFAPIVVIGLALSNYF